MKKCKLLISIMLILCILMTGCNGLKEASKGAAGSTKNQEDNKKTSEEEVVLSVYYVKDHLYYETALTSYDWMNKHVIIERKEFENEAALASQYATEMASGGGPDVLLLTDLTTIDVNKAAKGGNFADLTSYFMKDETYDKTQYYEKIMEAGVFDGKPYVVPFTFQNGFLYLRNSLLEQLHIDSVDTIEDYSKLANHLSDWYDQIVDSDPNCLGVSFGGYKGYDMQMLLLRSSGLTASFVKDNKVALKKEQSQCIADLYIKLKQNYMEKASELSQLQSKDMIMGHGILYGYGNLVLEGRTMDKTINGVLEEDGMLIGVPMFEGSKDYYAGIKDFGMVNKNSKKKEVAYELLRYLMDYMPVVDSFKVGLCINRENIRKLAEQAIRPGSFKMGDERVYYEKASEKLYETWVALLDEITCATIPNYKVEAMYISCMQDYIEGIKSFDECYQVLDNKLQLYLLE